LGNKYTTTVATSDGDWWLRARILMLRDFLAEMIIARCRSIHGGEQVEAGVRRP
jgi:hypothetical protein